MENKNLIIIALVAVVLLLVGLIAGMSLNSNTTVNNSNDTNDTLNISINETNETTSADSTKNTKSNKKTSDSNIESETIKENYQAGDGSHYREVNYKDGNFRQYDSNGKLIGSSYESDQAQLKKDACDSWPGD